MNGLYAFKNTSKRYNVMKKQKQYIIVEASKEHFQGNKNLADQYLRDSFV